MGVRAYNGYYTQDATWLATFCPTALKKGNLGRLKPAQSPWVPAVEQDQENKDELALLQGEAQTARLERAQLQSRITALQQELEATERDHQLERTGLVIQRDQAQTLLEQQQGTVAHLQNTLFAKTAQLEAFQQSPSTAQVEEFQRSLKCQLDRTREVQGEARKAHKGAPSIAGW